jgi:sucrose-6-phosphate hydrolase SacC (GH32 family)
MITRRSVALWPWWLSACGGGPAGDIPAANHQTTNVNTPSTPPAPPLVSEADAWRPRYHYTALRNWMNDPNGLCFYDGEYHLYYQYNPLGAQWGNIAWGHAVSRDLVAWQEQPVALPATDRVMAFSGSVVVDHGNHGGFAPAGSGLTALVAFFTGFDPVSKIQSQHIAYSLDRGRSFTAYAGNPVIDIGSTEFRDPKVFWHAPSGHWVMLVVAALLQEMWIYTSTNLKTWTKVSTFGPAGSAANNIWEVPDLFELPIDGDANRKRWVLVISVNHGSLWGGSGVQYFIGDFDGTRFVADPSSTVDALTPPAAEVFADFEGAALAPGWHSSGSAFGSGPVAGALPGQQHVSGHLGRGLVNSFHGGDSSTGTLSSPPFTITRRHLSFLIAGGSTHMTRLELLVGDQVVRQASGDDSEVLRWKSWDVSPLLGLQGVLRAVDEATGSWGHVCIDHIVMSDAAVVQAQLADITLWADHGRDFYAPTTFANLPDGRVLWLGWMSNWDYARLLPTQPWRGQQSSVRQLDLMTTPRGLRLRQRIADEVRAWVQPEALLSVRNLSSADAATALVSKAPAGRQWLARLEVPLPGLRAPIGLELFKGSGQALRVGFDPTRRSFFIDRTTSTPRFAGYAERHDAARLLDTDAISMEVWTDGSTVELLADNGSVVISDMVYPDPAATGVALFHGAENPPLRWLELSAVRAAMFAPA